MTHLLFLPGAGGAAEFWHPLGRLLPDTYAKTYLNWPGLGHEAHRPGLDSLDALTAYAAARLQDDTVIVAQSMGGIFALRLALLYPQRVKKLVLTAASGGIDVMRFGASDWRPAYRAEYPQAATWITAARADHTAEISSIAQPALLLWGDADTVSPVAVGRHLAGLLRDSRLQVIAGGTHSFAQDRAAEIAPLVENFLKA
ncbi:MAG: alpha/beta hydrolase [Ferrovibrio sp.]|uniref:alpha/beta fold hydrolase n=1 Tax=Ferrovibrio sp. TaxID=1917215 RepID=UPI002628016B|nr:alpha/beta fold hydrolase [Ferrovibrio sp.]MCW0233659.1 alpha/beta hydrolase [Ferrovibrio sp.]